MFYCCNRPASFVICNPPVPPDVYYTPISSLDTSPQYRHLVVKSVTTTGQHDMSSACRSGWCFVRCTPYPITPMPSIPPGRGIWWPRIVLTWVPLTWAHVLLSAVFNRPSWVFKSTSPPPVQASSGQECYYCRSAWYVVRLWVRLMYGQMYSPISSPLCPLNAPIPTPSKGI